MAATVATRPMGPGAFVTKPHQQKAVDELHNGCILAGGVGSGKTWTSLVYWYTKVCMGVVGDFGSMENPTDLYVITTAKKRDSRDWQKDAMRMGVGLEEDVNPSNVTFKVDSYNNIKEYQDVKGAFFIFDEQRVVGSGAWTKAFIKIAKHNKWILLSATPGDTWMDYIPVFIANGFVKNRTEFKRNHVIYNNFAKFPKVDRYIGVGKLVKWRNSILVQMPFERHTTRHKKIVETQYDEDKMRRVMDDRWHVYEDRPLKDVGELFRVMRKVANTDPSRVEALRSLMTQHPKLVVFYNFDYELEILRNLASEVSRTSSTMRPTATPDGISSTHEGVGSLSGEAQSSSSEQQSDPEFSVAEWNGHKHQELPTSERWLYLVQYVAGSEGWNCVTTDAVAFYSLTYSYKNFEQAHGRIDRLNTPFSDLYYYVLKSKAPIERGIWGSLNEKENFQESRFGPAQGFKVGMK